MSSFFATSHIPISAAFEDTIAIKWSKSISVIRTIDWRALEVRARKPHPRPADLKKYAKIIISWGICFLLVARAQVLAQTFDARH